MLFIRYSSLCVGHKEKCKFKECVCRSCLVVVQRQKITASRVAHLRHQRKMAATAKKAFSQHVTAFNQPNPLTEEEEFVLSSQLRTTKNEDADEKTKTLPLFSTGTNQLYLFFVGYIRILWQFEII